MRKVKWSDYKVKRSNFIKIRARLGFRKQSSSRVRDGKERDILIKLDKARIESKKKEGKFKILGPRRIKFEI